MSNNLQEMLRQREELERQIKQAQQENRKGVIEQIQQLMRDNELSVQDLLTRSGRGGKDGGGKDGEKRPVAAKYRDPASGKTWTGRGLKPKWVTEALESGKTLDDLSIKEPATA